jgi:hypothetical protein
MAYEIKWNVAGQVVALTLCNHVSLDEMKMINGQVLGMIEQADRKIAILIDMSGLNTGYYTVEHLQATQQYMHHRGVDSIVVVADNKLNRLISLLVFGLARPPVMQFDNVGAAQRQLVDRGFPVSPTAMQSS